MLCFDGTSNEYDEDVRMIRVDRGCMGLTGFEQNTNVVKLFALLKKDDFDQQLCYYQVRWPPQSDVPSTDTPSGRRPESGHGSNQGLFLPSFTGERRCWIWRLPGA